ncbi:hypothetical protein N7513_004831 [Penicillium frequentans]|nr:hypothetical protein N7513_004831 [Penicillium glabrum]
MFEAIKTWFSGREATEENKWDATNVQMQQPNSPAGMNETVTQQPTPESMDVHIRGGGEGEDVCCGVCAGLCCFECCECCC